MMSMQWACVLLGSVRVRSLQKTSLAPVAAPVRCQQLYLNTYVLYPQTCIAGATRIHSVPLSVALVWDIPGKWTGLAMRS